MNVIVDDIWKMLGDCPVINSRGERVYAFYADEYVLSMTCTKSQVVIVTKGETVYTFLPF